MTLLTIPGDPPPGTNAQHRMHWSKVAKMRTWWRGQAHLAWLAAGRPRFEHPLVVVRFVFATARTRDKDNLGAAVKPLLDGLKDDRRTGSLGAFPDDDATSIDLRPVEIAVDKRAPRVEIELAETAACRGVS